jgi:hypothetical protein
MDQDEYLRWGSNGTELLKTKSYMSFKNDRIRSANSALEMKNTLM